MTKISQKRALKNYRNRLAKRLAEGGSDATRIRATVRRTVSGEPPKKGGILAALRRSPLVGADFDVSREVTCGREVEP